MEQEIARRIIREFIRGILEHEQEKDDKDEEKEKEGDQQERKQNMFQFTRVDNHIGNNLSASNLKLNVACLVTNKGESQSLFQHPSSENATTTTATNIDTAINTATTLSSSSSSYTTTTTTTQQNSSTHYKQRRIPQYTIQRDFVIKIPRMIRASKKRKFHRPFVIMNVIPMMKMANPNNANTNVSVNVNVSGSDEEVKVSSIANHNAPGFKMIHGDTWISLKSTLKGFARKM